jgi:hypothetical protein
MGVALLQGLAELGRCGLADHVGGASFTVSGRSEEMPDGFADRGSHYRRATPIGDDQLWGVVRERKGADRTLAALRSIRAARPGGYLLFVIMDNLSANKTPAIRRWAQHENVELCFTPTNASWTNPIEAQFEPVRTFVIGTSDYRNHPVATTVSFGPTMTAPFGSTWRHRDGSMWPRFKRHREEGPGQGRGQIEPTCDSR